MDAVSNLNCGCDAGGVRLSRLSVHDSGHKLHFKEGCGSICPSLLARSGRITSVEK